MEVFCTIQAEFYMSNGLSRDSIGMSMTIDETRLVPNLMSDYIELSPGNAYDVQLSVTETARIEAPYTSRCSNDYPPKCKMSGAYSMARCSAGCIYHEINTSCNCTDPTGAEGDLEEDFKEKVLCQTEQEINCILKHWEKLGREGMEDRLVKPCTPECRRVKYTVINPPIKLKST